MKERVWGSRYLRRILFAVGFLTLLDPFVVPTVQRLERSRYESDRLFRFEYSDLFAIGPLVEYLRENPQGQRPRVVFFGNSVVWGYWLQPRETIPAQFQRLSPKSKVFNFGVNGFESGSAYLITKAIIDSIDVTYLFHVNGPANPILPRLIPVSPGDVRQFVLTPADSLERSLEDLIGFWSLYRYSYRLQAALFGTSTRLYLYLNKGRILEALREMYPSRGASDPGPMSGGEVQGDVKIDSRISRDTPSVGQVRELAVKYPLLWEYAQLIRDHAKIGIVVEIEGYGVAVEDADRADLNAHFHPNVLFVKLRVPQELRQADGLHLSPAGTSAVASSLLVPARALAHIP